MKKQQSEQKVTSLRNFLWASP